ncbi:MAG: peptide ABC transporter substrate-binding protein, partial [Myxococcaceae bacterium]
KIGLNEILEPRSDFSSELSRLSPDGNRAHDLYLRRIGADYAHPNTFFTFFERTGNNYTGWEHLDDGALISRFEKLLGKGDASPVEDGGEYAQAEKVLLSEGIALIPLYHPDRYFRARPTLVGLGVDPFNFLSLRELRLKQ